MPRSNDTQFEDLFAVSERIREAMFARHKNNAGMARAYGCSDPRMIQLSNYAVDWRVKTFLKLCLTADISAEYALTGKRPGPYQPVEFDPAEFIRLRKSKESGVGESLTNSHAVILSRWKSVRQKNMQLATLFSMVERTGGCPYALFFKSANDQPKGTEHARKETA